MSYSINFNPMATTNGAGSFNVTSDGLVQGTAMDDPAIRYKLRSGVITQNTVMWGGMGISANIPTPGFPAGLPAGVLQENLSLATALAGSSAPAALQLTGFTVFDQAYNLFQTPQSPVPTIGQNGTINFYPLGSGARIAVACDPILANLEGLINTSRVAWDFGAQMLVPYESAAYTVSSGTYVSATGVGTVTLSTAPAFSAGDITLASLTGTGAFAGLDGSWPILGVVGSVVTFQATVGLGAATITGGSATEDTTQSVALPCSILGFNFLNSMTVQYNNNQATWNRSGSCALIRI